MEVLDVEISEISKIYQVRRLGRDDVDLSLIHISEPTRH